MITPDTSVEFLDPSVLVYLTFNQHNIKTVRDLLNIRDEDLCRWRHINAIRMDEVHAMQEKARSLMDAHDKKPVTLFEEIKSMSVDQLAAFLCTVMNNELMFDTVKDRLLSPP